MGKIKNLLGTNESKSERIKQVATGTRISFRVLINSRAVELTLFFSIFSFLIFSVYYYLTGSSWINYVPYLVLIISGFFLFIYIIKLGYSIKFNFKEGLDIYEKTSFFRFPILLLILSIIGPIIIILISGIISGLPSSSIIYILVVSIVTHILPIYWLVWGTLIMFLIFLLYFIVNPYTFIVYSIKILNDSLIGQGSKLAVYEKSKIYHAIKIAYGLYQKEIRYWFGKEVVNEFNYDSLLKLSAFVGLLNSADIESRKELLKILIKLRDNPWYEKRETFTEIKNDIDNLTKKFNINITISKKESVINTLRTYTIPIIFLINLMLVFLQWLGNQ